jgi:ABC-2 type transport system permease protein
MAMTAQRALVRKDLQLFFSDRRSVIVSFVVPIVIASFFGSLFGGSGASKEPPRIDVAIVDQDQGAIARAIVAGAQADPTLRVATPGLDEARSAVRLGKTGVAVVIPKGFGDAAGAALFGGGAKPALSFLYDPSHAMDLAMLRGILTQHVMQAVTREMFGGAGGQAFVERGLADVQASGLPEPRKATLAGLLKSLQEVTRQSQALTTNGGAGLQMPYTTTEEAVTSGTNVAYNGYAHSFAGMSLQFLLFAMANLGVEMLLERQRGLWQRLRSAPLSRFTFLAGKAASGTLISLMVLWVCFGFAMAVFQVRILGSVLGFVAVSVASALMAACFGLLVAALGNTPATARGITTLAVLMMVMLGGAWVPTFVFPAWLQQATRVVPVRWAVDGLDAMTWRGLGLADAVAPTLVLLGFAALFGAIAAARFRWQEA